MTTFDSNNLNNLKEFLYYSYVHDARMERLEYNCGESSVKLTLRNTFFQSTIDMLFCDVDTVLWVQGKDPGSRDTLISLSVETDYSYLGRYLAKTNFGEGALYLLFQMFSGSELHIVSKKVIVNDATGRTN